MVPDTLALALYKQTVQNLDKVHEILFESVIIVDEKRASEAVNILKDTRDAYQVLIKHIEIGRRKEVEE